MNRRGAPILALAALAVAGLALPPPCRRTEDPVALLDLAERIGGTLGLSPADSRDVLMGMLDQGSEITFETAERALRARAGRPAPIEAPAPRPSGSVSRTFSTPRVIAALPPTIPGVGGSRKDRRANAAAAKRDRKRAARLARRQP